MVSAILLMVIVNSLMAGHSLWKIKKWKERGFDARNIRWKLIIFIGFLVGNGIGILAYMGSGNMYTSATVGISGYLMVLASVIDIMLTRIPSEPARLATFLGGVFFLISVPNLIMENYLSLGFWGIILVVFAICVYFRVMGDADMLIFVAFFFLFAWWLPPTEITVALFVMLILGLLTSGLAQVFNIGVEKQIRSSMKWNPETQRMEEVLSKETHTRKGKRIKEGKKRKFFPFGPAILVSFTAVALYASYTSIIIPSF